MGWLGCGCEVCVDGRAAQRAGGFKAQALKEHDLGRNPLLISRGSAIRGSPQP